MNTDNIVEEAKEIIREFHAGETTGHDYWHVMRVYNNALNIQSKEGGELFIIQMAALFHDFIDYKLSDDEEAQIEKVQDFLKDKGIRKDVVDRIIHAMRAVSFKGGQNPVAADSLEDKIVQDADRLDALGAVGIARTFIYGGSKKHELYDPDTAAREQLSFEQYKNEDNTMINHFYEKLLKLKSLMHTDTAEKLAEARHSYMEGYLNQFYMEWDGER